MTQPPDAAGGIRFNDRTIVFGVSGSGKSTLLNHLAAGIRCQVLVWDSKDELIVHGATPVTNIDRICWDDRVIHVIDDSCKLEHVEQLFDVCWRRKASREDLTAAGTLPGAYGLVVVVHELGDLCLDRPDQTPRAVINYLKKGRQRGLGLVGGSQRPVCIPRVARTEVQHVLTFASGLDPDDLGVVAKMHRMPIPEFAALLSDTQAKYGEHGHLWYDRRLDRILIRPALPEQLRKHTIAAIIEQEHPNGET